MSRHFFFPALAAGLAGLLLSSLAPLAAQGERRIEAAEARLRAMGQRVEELQAQGKHQEAEELARRLREMRRGLRQRLQNQNEQREREEILAGLEQGMHALERLGRRDALDVLRRIAEEVRAEGEHPEIREARRQLEVLRTALHAFQEADRGDAAERMQLAIRARELGLEGRRDEEAQALRRRAPGRQELGEMLRAAAELWAEFGHERRARSCAELAEQMLQRRRRAEGREGEGEGFDARLRRLEERLRRVERALERLQRARAS